MNIRIHDVTKIEVKKVNKGDSYITRDIVIHSRRYNYALGEYITEQTNLDLFLEDASASKLVYSKKVY
jgi:hypothetical protein|tara:strand:- start:145 stop:348 length:204 start_codon:yes stop_codon:yes gene_type:complete